MASRFFPRPRDFAYPLELLGSQTLTGSKSSLNVVEVGALRIDPVWSAYKSPKLDCTLSDMLPSFIAGEASGVSLPWKVYSGGAKGTGSGYRRILHASRDTVGVSFTSASCSNAESSHASSGTVCGTTVSPEARYPLVTSL
jgi:hypothetical protein